ncbi:MAG: trypsin-like peptidase domain-containing protein [Ilumatobacteraceae bacterium]
MNLQRRALPIVVGGLLAVSCGGETPSTPTTTGGGATSVTLTESAVQVIANGCSSIEVHGAGMMVAPGRIATVAHVVAGATSVEVRGVHGTAEATISYFDPILDVAVLKVGTAVARPVPIGDASPGDRGEVVVYRDEGPVELPVDVQRLVNIRTADIYGQGRHIRPGYELTLDIHAGDSGAVVVIDSHAVALVWATSRQAAARAWAMRASLLSDHLSGDAPVDNGECA